MDTSSANECNEEKLKLFLSEYVAEDDFNADETALFIKNFLQKEHYLTNEVKVFEIKKIN